MRERYPAARGAVKQDPAAVRGEDPSSGSMVVVLPAPFGPSRPKQLPAGMAKLSPSTALTPGKCLTRSTTSMMAAMACLPHMAGMDDA
jgi:topoisomerase IA-like protein